MKVRIEFDKAEVGDFNTVEFTTPAISSDDAAAATFKFIKSFGMSEYILLSRLLDVTKLDSEILDFVKFLNDETLQELKQRVGRVTRERKDWNLKRKQALLDL